MEEFKGEARLPKFAVPKRYDLKLKPDLIDCKFSGWVDISVDVISATKFLLLNAADLSIHPDSVIFNSDNQASKAVKVELFEADEIMVVEFGEDLNTGVGILSIAFEGTLNDRMKGFYRR
ncbi:metalloprotease [Lithospermum erythrorhizon]|uniref:Metalloprotease n=1 Tax=Lithospermum erythrorhizon TaxID=34254 RepID=A0AAV3NU67_LITER